MFITNIIHECLCGWHSYVITDEYKNNYEPKLTGAYPMEGLK